MEQVEDDISIPSAVTIDTSQDDTSIPSAVTIGTHGGIPSAVTVTDTQQSVAPTANPQRPLLSSSSPPGEPMDPNPASPQVTVDEATAERGSHSKISFTKHGSIVT